VLEYFDRQRSLLELVKVLSIARIYPILLGMGMVYAGSSRSLVLPGAPDGKDVGIGVRRNNSDEISIVSTSAQLTLIKLTF
jgi:hypothetical protein